MSPNSPRGRKKLSEDLALQALTDFLNAVEAGIYAARQRIKAVKVDLDLESIAWTQAQGSKGLYERSEDVQNPEFQTLLKKLEVHNGKLTQNGFFLWKFSGDNSVIGRKKRK